MDKKEKRPKWFLNMLARILKLVIVSITWEEIEPIKITGGMLQ